MPIVSVRIPQIGEGLQEARLVATLKQPGDRVRRDEPIYQMETDKAVMDVESPYEGVLTEWLANPDDVLPIGAEVARMEVAEGVGEVGGTHGVPPVTEAPTPPQEPSAGTTRNAAIPPRTRAYAKEKGLSDDVLATIPAPSGKLMPADIDAFLAAPAAGKNGRAHSDRPVGGKQRVLNSRMVRGNASVVPGTMTVAASWEPIQNLREQNKAAGGDFQPSAFTMFAYAVVQAMEEFPAFRTTLVGDDTFRTWEAVNLGIAVALPDDELTLAVVDGAETMDWPTFAQAMRGAIDRARNGEDQAHEAVTVSLTNMQAFGLRDAVPVVVPPAMGTLFLGEVYRSLDQEQEEPAVKHYANLTLTFDHRLANGVGAAEFLNRIKSLVQTVGNLCIV